MIEKYFRDWKFWVILFVLSYSAYLEAVFGHGTFSEKILYVLLIPLAILMQYPSGLPYVFLEFPLEQTVWPITLLWLFFYSVFVYKVKDMDRRTLYVLSVLIILSLILNWLGLYWKLTAYDIQLF